MGLLLRVRLSEAKANLLKGGTYMYAVTLVSYVDMLADKLRKGKISEEKFFRLANKLVAWEQAASERGIR